MDNIKIQVLGPVGNVLHEIETNYPKDQLDRFLTENRIVVFSDEESVHFVSKEHRWPFKNEKDED
jgi:hypothetical protein